MRNWRNTFPPLALKNLCYCVITVFLSHISLGPVYCPCREATVRFTLFSKHQLTPALGTLVLELFEPTSANKTRSQRNISDSKLELDWWISLPILSAVTYLKPSESWAINVIFECVWFCLNYHIRKRFTMPMFALFSCSTTLPISPNISFFTLT